MSGLKIESGDNSTVGYVQFPLTQKTFSDFVGKLLGEPQSVRGVLGGAFIVDINGIEKLYATIMQRVSQQNRANLIEFISKIYFVNNTNIMIKELEGLKSYRNLEDLKVIRLELTWNFLIQFEDKEAPEKQIIRIFFDLKNVPRVIDNHYIYRRMGGGIGYEISYTARTWGVDIENLLRSAINSTFLKKNKIKEKVAKAKDAISILIPIIIYVIIFGINNFFVRQYLDRSVQNIAEQIGSIELAKQTSFIAEYIASVPWYQFTTYNNLFLIIMFIICIIFAVYLDDMFDKILRDKSFIFLADSDQVTIMQQMKKELGKNQKKYFVTLLGNVACGILSNFVFQIILKIFGID